MFKQLVAIFTPQPPLPFEVLFQTFQDILKRNNSILEYMADMGDKLGGEYVFDRKYIVDSCDYLAEQMVKLITDLEEFNQRKNPALFAVLERIQQQIRAELAGQPQFSDTGYTLPMTALGKDRAEDAGNKMASLGVIRNHLNLSTPDGFVITGKGFLDFMTSNGLRERAEELVAAWDGTDESVFERMSEEMCTRIMKAPLPRKLSSQIKSQLRLLERSLKGRNIKFILRSSACGEDGESSFSGQYASVMNVSSDSVIDAYRQVLASTYSPGAWQYRLHRGWQEHEVVMAVGCLVMVDGQASGITRTYVFHDGEKIMQTSSLWGLCAPVGGGDVPTDTFNMARTSPYDLLSRSIVKKTRQMRTADNGGTLWEALPEERCLAPSLSTEQLETLARAAMTLERFYKRPQEIEWTFDTAGTLQILQAKQLHFSPSQEVAPPVNTAMRNAEVIIAGRGQVVQCGVGMGKVVKVNVDADLMDFPYGGILVAPYASPRFSRIMQKAQGIITNVGSPMGHMATIAREYRVPALVDVEGITELLEDGEEITLDATQNVIYRGRIMELDAFELIEEEVFEESYEYRLLKRLLKRMSSLYLVDSHSVDFKPSSCRTYHDIARLVHETAVERLIQLSDTRKAFPFSRPRRLESDIPLGLLIVDASGGQGNLPGASTVTLDQLSSVPLVEFLHGLEAPGMWCTDPVSVDMGSFMSSVTRTFSSSMASPQAVGRNLAVILGDYMNMHLRLGYHYTSIDATLSDVSNDNHAYFRFLGGVTDLSHRSRRASFIAQILERFDFRVETHGDLVVGRIKKLSLPRMIFRMRMLGALVGYTRQLDARMHTDSDVNSHIEQFIRASAPIIGG